jgi:hypothetical protein
MPMPENIFWPEANILLNSPSIKKLTISDSRKLICILSQSKLEKNNLESFIKDEERNIDSKRLESEIKGQEIKG